MKDPVPLIEKNSASCPGGRFPPSFIHQVIIITGLNKLYTTMCFRPEDGLRCRQGVNLPLQLKLFCFWDAAFNHGISRWPSWYHWPLEAWLYTIYCTYLNALCGHPHAPKYYGICRYSKTTTSHQDVYFRDRGEGDKRLQKRLCWWKILLPFCSYSEMGLVGAA